MAEKERCPVCRCGAKVLKRLAWMERDWPAGFGTSRADDVRWLLSLTRALLDSHRELLGTHGEICHRKEQGWKCDAVSRAEAVRRGEGL